MQISDLRFGWHADSYRPTMASIRLRLLEPMSFLQANGVQIEPYDAAKGPQAYDAIIFSKSLTHEAVRIARAAKARGALIIYDICDNVFEGKKSPRKARKIACLTDMLALADHVVFATSALQAQLVAHMPEIEARSRVIPDSVELHRSSAVGPLSLGEKIALWRLRRFLKRHPGALHCVWFGKSQGMKAGLAHVKAAVRELEIFAKRHPVTLTVISNKAALYFRVSRGWRVPHHYLSWSLRTFDRALAMHEVAVVPIERNSYTMGKTVNRPATAILAGLGVIADSIDSYEELRPFIVLDDWQGGLDRYWRQRPKTDEALRAAQHHLKARYGPERVGELWLRFLSEVASSDRQSLNSETQESRQGSIAQR